MAPQNPQAQWPDAFLKRFFSVNELQSHLEILLECETEITDLAS